MERKIDADFDDQSSRPTQLAHKPSVFVFTISFLSLAGSEWKNKATTQQSNILHSFQRIYVKFYFIGQGV